MFLLGQTVGKYQILANLGSGGFGTVFLARDTWIDKKVAIKVPHRQTGGRDELLQEPRLLAALDHPNIVGDPHRRAGRRRVLHRHGVRQGREPRGRSGPREVPRQPPCPQLRRPDPEGRRARPRGADPPPRPATRQRAHLRERRVQGGRLRYVAPPREVPRHHRDRQPALHGARGLPGPRRPRLRHLLGGRDALPDAHRCPPLLQPEPGPDRADGGPGPLHAAEAAQQPGPARDVRHRHEGAGHRR